MIIDQAIGVLTYNVRHRKTYDTLCLLKAKGYKNIFVYAQPMHYKKNFTPLLAHRPGINMNSPVSKDLCKNFGYIYQEGSLEQMNIPSDMPLLVCGAGILEEKFVKNHIIINSHPGYIPLSRGLDAFKWAIWEDKPIGVTTHFIGEFIDGGEILERRKIQLSAGDTFFEVAMRVYETEVSMLVEALDKLQDKHEIIFPQTSVLHRRMPLTIEKELLNKFEIYKMQHTYIENDDDNNALRGG